MNKKDFLNELENALEGRLSESDIREVVSDYGDIFDNIAESGKEEGEIAAQIGSPAKIARTILEDGIDSRMKPEQADSAASAASAENNGGREYTDFQKNINEKTSKIFDKVIEPDQNVEIDQLAPMPRRLGAYVLDSLLLGVLAFGILMLFAAPLFFVNYSSVEVSNEAVGHAVRIGEDSMMNGSRVASSLALLPILFMAFLFGIFSLFTTIFLWATNGYTPGKWILKMRVVKINGKKISFLDAFLREFVIKGIANSVLSGFLNIISFIWAYVTDDHKTAHDLVAQTRVVEWDKNKKGIAG